MTDLMTNAILFINLLFNDQLRVHGRGGWEKKQGVDMCDIVWHLRLAVGARLSTLFSRVRRTRTGCTPLAPPCLHCPPACRYGGAHASSSPSALAYFSKKPTRSPQPSCLSMMCRRSSLVLSRCSHPLLQNPHPQASGMRRILLCSR